MSDQADNSAVEYAPEPEPAPDGQSIHLELEVGEANALHQWLLKSMHEGATALDDPRVSLALQKLSHELEFVNTVAAVREELEVAGFDTADLGDRQVADLAQRIREAKGPRLH